MPVSIRPCLTTIARPRLDSAPKVLPPPRMERHHGSSIRPWQERVLAAPSPTSRLGCDRPGLINKRLDDGSAC